MLSLIKKDLRLLLSSKSNIFFMLFYIPLILLLVDTDSSNEYIYLVIIITYSYMVTTMTFGYDITYKTHLLVQSLPVGKNEIVISKYLLMFINFVISVIYAGVYLWILNMLNLNYVDYFNLAKLKIALPVAVIALSIALPVFFRLPPKIANIVNVFIYIITVNFFAMNISSLEGLLSNSLLTMFNGLGFTLVAIGIMTISMITSIMLYRTRDLK